MKKGNFTCTNTKMWQLKVPKLSCLECVLDLFICCARGSTSLENVCRHFVMYVGIETNRKPEDNHAENIFYYVRMITTYFEFCNEHEF